MTTTEQVRADTALIERLTAGLAAERAKREAADNCYDDLRREVERLRLTCSEQDRILSLARARAEAAEARVRALETNLRAVTPDEMGGYPDLFCPAGGWEAWEERALALLSGSGETAPAQSTDGREGA